MNSKPSKICILGDMHIGARNASPILCEYQLRFFETELFPYLKDNNIDTILQLGDLFDSRKFTNHIILHKWKTRFFDFMAENKIHFITLLGNHDVSSRNTLEVNSTSLFLGGYKNVTIIDNAYEYTFQNSTKFLLIPWICQENKDSIEKMVEMTDAIYCAGHFEFSGFEMQRGIDAHGGEDAHKYDKFDTVFSGHYHTKSKKKHVLYTGVPYEMTWADYNDVKGFHIFDTKTHKLKFVETKTTLFNRILYDDKGIEPIDPKDVNGSYVKVVVVNKTDPYKFEKFISKLVAQNPADLKITDIAVDFDSVDFDDELELEDTKTLIGKFVDQSDTELDKNELKKLINVLYLAALEVTE